MRTLSIDLAPHPSCPDFCVDWVNVVVTSLNDGLRLTYSVDGDIGSLVVPSREDSRRVDGLWRSTCVEAFIAPPAGGYREFNFSPAGLWASYDFTGYRDGMTAAETSPPQFSIHQTDRRLVIDVWIEKMIGKMALSAVFEDKSGALNYWALAHPSDKPDFHHPDSFVLDLP